jgi:hypothetical protein
VLLVVLHLLNTNPNYIFHWKGIIVNISINFISIIVNNLDNFIDQGVKGFFAVIAYGEYG